MLCYVMISLIITVYTYVIYIYIYIYIPGQSFAGMIWPRAAVSAAAMWNYVPAVTIILVITMIVVITIIVVIMIVVTTIVMIMLVGHVGPARRQHRVAGALPAVARGRELPGGLQMRRAHRVRKALPRALPGEGRPRGLEVPAGVLRARRRGSPGRGSLRPGPSIYIYIYVYTHMCMYIYIYIYNLTPQGVLPRPTSTSGTPTLRDF